MDSKIPELTEPTADDFKDQGNQCVRNANFTEAILHYSTAIKLTPNDPILYSNRSLAFLKIQQLYYANEDAEKAISLKPDWAKGHFRKAEALIAASQFDLGLLSYGRALSLQPNDVNILNAAKAAAALIKRENMFESRIPWVGAGIGIILGVIIVISDQLLTAKSTINHPSLMILLVFAVSFVGYGIAKLYRYYVKLQRKGMLDPPVDLLEGFNKEEEQEDEQQDQMPNRNRYTKSQARQRFRKGKT